MTAKAIAHLSIGENQPTQPIQVIFLKISEPIEAIAVL
jgi:hypothetical protein